MEVFGIKIEFEHDLFRSRIAECRDRKEKGYVCVVDGNVLAMAHNDVSYRKIINKAYVNTCDGGSIATMCNKIYGTDYSAFNGPDLFAEYIERTDIKQMLLGNTKEKYRQIKARLEDNGVSSSHLSYMSLPFATVDEFDYKTIACEINKIQPDFIWVSLGAPKQENFMYRILPFLDSGLLFGIGAAFNFYVGENVQPKIHIGSFRFTWLDRIFREPKKQLKRVGIILRYYPKIYGEEKNKAKKKD